MLIKCIWLTWINPITASECQQGCSEFKRDLNQDTSLNYIQAHELSQTSLADMQNHCIPNIPRHTSRDAMQVTYMQANSQGWAMLTFFFSRDQTPTGLHNIGSTPLAVKSCFGSSIDVKSCIGSFYTAVKSCFGSFSEHLPRDSSFSFLQFRCQDWVCLFVTVNLCCPHEEKSRVDVEAQHNNEPLSTHNLLSPSCSTLAALLDQACTCVSAQQ